ncbi:hypothetical protein BVRB_1g014550 [Beta vulgaris subsp. vulgaris]|nr:hypothetical protein BVRB_1g014550 [Beta vulgaris subsp. vulgaris]
MGRAPCCDKDNVKRGPWAPEEDAKLKSYIEKHGTAGNWIALPQKIGLKRCGKSCRLRWLNYLRPNIKHGKFSEEEDKVIISLYVSIGSRWSIIAAQLPGRTDNDIKNYWNTRLKKKLFGKQRRDHQQQARKKSNLLIKQEENNLVEPISFSSSFNTTQVSYWPQLTTTSMPGAISTPNYSNFSSELCHGLNDHNSIRKLLMKVGGNYDNFTNPPFIPHYNNTTYPSNIIIKQNNNHSNLNSDTMISSEMTNSSLYNLGGSSGVEIGMVEGQRSTFPPELEELMSSNPQKGVDGVELFYGDYGNKFVNNDGSTSDNTTCGESSSWDEMTSLVSLHNLESDCNVLIQGIGEEDQFEENLRYPTPL